MNNDRLDCLAMNLFKGRGWILCIGNEFFELFFSRIIDCFL